MADSERPVVLVVEDNAILLTMFADMAEEGGYAALAASDAAHALDLAAAHPELAVLVTDQNLSGETSGLDLAAQVATSCPDARIVLVSGVAPRDLPAGYAFLQKPFVAQDLLRVLDGGRE